MAAIVQSVGRGGANLVPDVKLIQRLLNRHVANLKLSKVAEDGNCGPKTIAAITIFQREVLKVPSPDGKVAAGGKTFVALGKEPSAAPKSASAGHKGSVKGRLSGVNPRIIEYLQAVADHYGVTIDVVSGKRDSKGQAEAMWTGWAGHLRRGEIYTYLKRNAAVRKKLDDLYNANSKAKFAEEISRIGREISRHLTGEAVDVALSTNSKIISALSAGLHYLPEKNSLGIKCHHFDTRRLVSASSVKMKWPTV